MSSATGPDPADPPRRRAPQQQRAAETEKRILDAAESLFAQKGFEAVTTKQLAQASGVATGALYHHFDGKDEIYRAVVQRAFEARSAVPEHLLDRSLDPEPRLVGLIEWFTSTILADESFRLLFSRELLDPQEGSPHLLNREVFQQGFGVLREVVEDTLPDVNLDEAAAIVLALAYGLSNLRGIYEIYPGATPLGTPHEVAVYTTRILLHGLGGGQPEQL